MIINLGNQSPIRFTHFLWYFGKKYFLAVKFVFHQICLCWKAVLRGSLPLLCISQAEAGAVLTLDCLFKDFCTANSLGRQRWYLCSRGRSAYRTVWKRRSPAEHRAGRLACTPLQIKRAPQPWHEPTVGTAPTWATSPHGARGPGELTGTGGSCACTLGNEASDPGVCVYNQGLWVWQTNLSACKYHNISDLCSSGKLWATRMESSHGFLGKNKQGPTQVGFRATRRPPGSSHESSHPGRRQEGEVRAPMTWQLASVWGLSCEGEWDNPPPVWLQLPLPERKQQGVLQWQCPASLARPAERNCPV